MRVALTGASGYVGRAITLALVARGHDVTVLARRPDDRFAAGVRPIAGDLREPGALRALVEDADAVVHAAAYVHRRAETAAARAECFAVNVDGTVALMAAMRAGTRRPSLVFISSTAVYGAATDNLDERAPLAPVTTYGESKVRAEVAVLGAASKGEIAACVLRPCVVYGPGAPGNFARLESLIRRGLMPLVRGGTNRKSLVHVDDLAVAVVRVVEAGAVVNGRVFNVAGPSLSVRETAEAIARGLGVPLRALPVPGWAFALGAGLARAVSRASGGRVPDLGRSLEVFAETATVDGSALARDLGVSFREPAAVLAAAVRGHGRAR